MGKGDRTKASQAMAQERTQCSIHVSVFVALHCTFQASEALPIAHCFIGFCRSIDHLHPAISIEKGHLNVLAFGANQINVLAADCGFNEGAGGGGGDHGLNEGEALASLKEQYPRKGAVGSP